MIEKLVRNGPGTRIRAEGRGRIRVAGEHEMPLLLARKLVEDAQEVLAGIQTGVDRTKIVEELADVAEVIHGLRNAVGIRKDDVRAARHAKRIREGDFDQRLVWERIWERE
jgi:predicted house-cleaning noncanonical NTP pyrophosphatase (MazG superfamily)